MESPSPQSGLRTGGKRMGRGVRGTGTAGISSWEGSSRGSTPSGRIFSLSARTRGKAANPFTQPTNTHNTHNTTQHRLQEEVQCRAGPPKIWGDHTTADTRDQGQGTCYQLYATCYMLHATRYTLHRTPARRPHPPRDTQPHHRTPGSRSVNVQLSPTNSRHCGLEARIDARMAPGIGIKAPVPRTRTGKSTLPSLPFPFYRPSMPFGLRSPRMYILIQHPTSIQISPSPSISTSTSTSPMPPSTSRSRSLH